jgi:hypothetical protein
MKAATPVSKASTLIPLPMRSLEEAPDNLYSLPILSVNYSDITCVYR